MLTKSRLSASIGAGGVLYLTPIVFNSLSLSASEIGTGIAFAAISGTITRLITGYYLDKGIAFKNLLKVAALVAIIADLMLIVANNYHQFIFGELLLGAAAGIYWPSVEIAVPITCKGYQSSKGFALVRTADALGVSIGTLLGSLAAFSGNIRLIYVIEIICLMIFLRIIREGLAYNQTVNINNNKIRNQSIAKDFFELIPRLFPLLIISLFATGMLSLLQSALPLDLVMGGINRPPLNESSTGFLIAIQLGLLLLIQWPIGNWLTKRDITYGLKLSIISFFIGNLALCLSSLYSNGIILTAIGLIFVSIGLASFLPTATEAVVRICPQEKRGISMAIYSQCFGISAFVAPWMAGKLIDISSHSTYIWLFSCIGFTLIFPIAKRVRIESTVKS